MYDDFDRLESVVDLEGTFINITPIRVGTGRESGLQAEADIAVYRVEDKIVIPGSSIKGMLRALAESILRARASTYPTHGISKT